MYVCIFYFFVNAHVLVRVRAMAIDVPKLTLCSGSGAVGDQVLRELFLRCQGTVFLRRVGWVVEEGGWGEVGG
jgi:hypothetical protein